MVRRRRWSYLVVVIFVTVFVVWLTRCSVDVEATGEEGRRGSPLIDFLQQQHPRYLRHTAYYDSLKEGRNSQSIRIVEEEEEEAAAAVVEGDEEDVGFDLVVDSPHDDVVDEADSTLTIRRNPSNLYPPTYNLVNTSLVFDCGDSTTYSKLNFTLIDFNATFINCTFDPSSSSSSSSSTTSSSLPRFVISLPSNSSFLHVSFISSTFSHFTTSTPLILVNSLSSKPNESSIENVIQLNVISCSFSNNTFVSSSPQPLNETSLLTASTISIGNASSLLSSLDNQPKNQVSVIFNIITSEFTGNNNTVGSCILISDSVFQLEVIGSLFLNNNGYIGSAINILQSQLPSDAVGNSLHSNITVLDSDFVNNSAIVSSAAIHINNAILIARVSLVSSSFENNTATTLSPLPFAAGAISIGFLQHEKRNSSAQVEVIRCIFFGNRGTAASKLSAAGAFYSALPMTLLSTEFRKNSLPMNFVEAAIGSRAGGLVSLGPVFAEHSNFYNNQGMTGGWAIGNASALHLPKVTVISNCLFKNNFGQLGGALGIAPHGEVIVRDSSFHHNIAIVSGGGIFFLRGKHLDVRSCEFIDQKVTGKGPTRKNYPRGGGAVSFFGAVDNENDVIGHSKYLILEDNLFAHNIAIDCDGGAVMITEGLLLRTKINRCSFHWNGADNFLAGKLADSAGGAIYMDHIRDARIDNCLFLGNTAAVCGGAVSVSGIVSSAHNNTFLDNRSALGGGICLSPSTDSSYTAYSISISSSVFYNNQATWGSAIFEAIGNISLLNSGFKDNIALQAGAIYVLSVESEVTAENVYFEENVSPFGAGLYIFDGTVNGTALNFTGNSGSDGAAIYLDGGSLNCKDCPFQNNTISGLQAVKIDFGFASLVNCAFVANTEALGTSNSLALVGTEKLVLNLVNCTFTSNIETSVSAISFRKGSINIRDCYFESYSSNTSWNQLISSEFSDKFSFLSITNSIVVMQGISSWVSSPLEFSGNVTLTNCTIISLEGQPSPTISVQDNVNFQSVRFVNQVVFFSSSSPSWDLIVTTSHFTSCILENSSFVASPISYLEPGILGVTFQDTILNEGHLLFSGPYNVTFDSSYLFNFFVNISSEAVGIVKSTGISGVGNHPFLYLHNSTVTFERSSLCNSDPQVSGLECLEGILLGDIPSSISTSGCRVERYPTPIGPLLSVSADYLTTASLCSPVQVSFIQPLTAVSFELFIQVTNYASAQLELASSPPFFTSAPTSDDIITLSLTPCDEPGESGPSIQFPALVNASAQLSAGWSTPYSTTPGLEYCLTLSLNTSSLSPASQGVSVDLRVSFVLRGIFEAFCEIHPQNLISFNDEKFAFTYALKDQLSIEMVPEAPVPIVDSDGTVVDYIEKGSGVTVIFMNATASGAPITIRRVYLFSTSGPSAFVIVLSPLWILGISIFAVCGTMGYCFLKRRREYLQMKSLNKEIIQEQETAIHELTSMWQIEASELVWLKMLDRGGAGEVWKCEWREQLVAVKKLQNVLGTSSDEEAQEEFQREINFLKTIRHPNIVMFYGAGTLGNGVPFLVQEFMARGSLFSLLKNEESRDLTWIQKLKFCIDAAEGMNFLHSCDPPRIHRDLKPQNLLVTNNFTVKIADFGTSKLIGVGTKSKTRSKRSTQTGMTPSETNDLSSSSFSSSSGSASHILLLEERESSYSHNTFFDMTMMVGSILYMAPELGDMKKKLHYGTEVDVYSFGITMWVIAKGTGEQPFSHCRKMIEVTLFVEEGGRPEIDPEWPEGLSELMIECWHPIPGNRPKFSQILARLKNIHQRLVLVEEREGDDDDDDDDEEVGHRKEGRRESLDEEKERLLAI